MAEIQDGDQNGSYIGNFQIISLYNDWIWLVICLNNITGGILILQFQLLQKKSIWRKSKMASKMAPENGISHSNRPNYHMGCNMSKPRVSWSGNPNFTISTSSENQYGGNPR